MNTASRALKRVYVFLFVRKIFYPLHLFCYKLGMFGLGMKNYENDTVSGEKAFIRYLVSRNKLSSGVILDIGAYAGNYSAMLRKSGISLPVFAFEPHPAAFKKLEEVAARNLFQRLIRILFTPMAGITFTRLLPGRTPASFMPGHPLIC